jgi:anti-anti-sigma regulatory factor
MSLASNPGRVQPSSMQSTMAGAAAPAAPKVPGAVGTAEHYSAPLPPTQEAAVLYANGYTEAAVQLLKLVLRDPVGKNNIQAWIMLLDLYLLSGNRKEFDALSMLFTVKFETSPPVWRSLAELDDPRRTQKREAKDFFTLKPVGGSIAGEIDTLIEFAEEAGSIRLDVGKLNMITPEESQLFAAALKKLHRAKMAVWFNNINALYSLLKRVIKEDPSAAAKGHWALMFEVMILDGKQAEFEELGLEFAMAFEESPPNWETYVNPKATDADKSAKGEDALATDGFQIRGAFSDTNARSVLTELNQYAMSHTEVIINAINLFKIDFMSMDVFFDAVKSIQLSGKRVIISNLSELIHGLLEAFLVNRHAILVRKKQN